MAINTAPVIPGQLYSINRFVGDGSTIQWEIHFAGGYISRSHVFARTLDPYSSEQIEFTWVGDNTVQISPAISAGRQFQIYRDTPKSSPLADFTDGAVLTEGNLDINAMQAVFIAAEALDAAVTGIAVLSQGLRPEYLVGLPDLITSAAFYYDIAVSVPYSPITNEEIFSLPVTRSFLLPANFAGARTTCRTPAVGQAVILHLRKLPADRSTATLIGTLTFSVGAKVGVFSSSVETLFSPGEILSLKCTQTDASVEGFAVNLYARKA